MIQLITTVDQYRLEWLPQFVEHYRRAGVQRFLVSVHVAEDRTPAAIRRIRDRARAVLEPKGVSLQGILQCPYNSPVITGYQNQVRLLHCREEDWIVWADIDEFHEFPGPLCELIDARERAGNVQVIGHLVDRVARGGELASFDPGRSIWEQYPIVANVTEKILGGMRRKVAASTAGCEIGSGHHSLKDGSSRSVRSDVLIHHFKWDATVLERLKPRLAGEFKKRCWWWVETRKFYDHIERHGRIELEGLDVYEPAPWSTPSPPGRHSAPDNG